MHEIALPELLDRELVDGRAWRRVHLPREFAQLRLRLLLRQSFTATLDALRAERPLQTPAVRSPPLPVVPNDAGAIRPLD